MSSLDSASATTNDFKIKIRSSDTEGGYLFDKLKVDSATMTITVGNGTSGEKMTISVNSLVYNNYTSTTNPTVTDDIDGGYTAGSIWLNATDDILWVCLDNTDGAAVWKKIYELNNVVTDLTVARTLTLADEGRFIEFNNGAATDCIVPPDVFDAGATVDIQQVGAGTVTIVEGLGVTINSIGGALDTGAQWGIVRLIQTATNVWTAFGSLA